MEQNTSSKITAALSHIEAELRTYFTNAANKQLDRVIAELERDGMDARINFDYPSSSKFRTRDAYKQQEAKYNFRCKFFKSRKCSISMSEPDFVDLKANAREMIAAEAAKLAKLSLEGFIAKLAAKIDATGIKVETVSYEGSIAPAQYSFLKVNGGAQVWKSQMILNVSSLGKLFNQWPTRLMK